MSNAMVGFFVDEEEEEDEKSFMQKLGQAMASGFSSLVLGRDFGNATKTMINYGVEKINENYLDFLRNGEYDPYKDAIQFTIIPPANKGQKGIDAFDLMANIMGPFGAAMKTGELMIKKATEEPKKKEDAIARSEKEKNVRIPLEVLGNLGLIPLYKDVRKIVNAQIYKDLKNAKSKDSSKKMTDAEFKRMFPNEYKAIQDAMGEDEYIKKVNDEVKRMEKQIQKETGGY
jgi:hypothetical protein